MLASFTSTDLNQKSEPVGIPARFKAVENRSKAKARLSYSYAERDYRHVTPSIGEKRNESRHTVSASLDVPLGGAFSFKPQLRYMDRNSNLPSSDYDEYVVTSTLSYKL
jgi:hypothetical protein